MRRERVINKLRELGYKFKRDAWRVQVWRHPTTKHTIEVRKRDEVGDDWVRCVLRQAGCNPVEIDTFFRDCNN